MTIQKFEDIIAWQKAQDQAVLLLEKCDEVSRLIRGFIKSLN